MKKILLIVMLSILLISCENIEQIEKEEVVNQEESVVERVDLHVIVQNQDLNRNLYSFELVSTEVEDIRCSVEFQITSENKTIVIEDDVGLIKPGEIKEHQMYLNLPEGSSRIHLETYCNLV